MKAILLIFVTFFVANVASTPLNTEVCFSKNGIFDDSGNYLKSYCAIADKAYTYIDAVSKCLANGMQIYNTTSLTTTSYNFQCDQNLSKVLIADIGWTYGASLWITSEGSCARASDTGLHECPFIVKGCDTSETAWPLCQYTEAPTPTPKLPSDFTLPNTKICGYYGIIKNYQTGGYLKNYCFVEKIGNYTDASAYCGENGMQLYGFDSNGTSNNQLALILYNESSFWVAQLINGTWITGSGEPLDSSVKPNNNNGDTNQCLTGVMDIFSLSVTFNSIACDTLASSICEYKLTQVLTTTEAPITEAPITESPTTEAPVTEAPTTEAPVTEAPTTEAPITEAPITEAPITEAPITEAPITEAPITEAPITESPITEAPSITTTVPTIPPTTQGSSSCETEPATAKVCTKQNCPPRKRWSFSKCDCVCKKDFKCFPVGAIFDSETCTYKKT